MSGGDYLFGYYWANNDCLRESKIDISGLFRIRRTFCGWNHWFCLYDIVESVSVSKEEAKEIYIECFKKDISLSLSLDDDCLEFVSLVDLYNHFPKLFMKLESAQWKQGKHTKQHIEEINQLKDVFDVIGKIEKESSFLLRHFTKNETEWFRLADIFNFCSLNDVKAVKTKIGKKVTYYNWKTINTWDFIRKNSIKSQKDSNCHENYIKVEDFCEIVPEASLIVMNRVKKQETWI